MAAFGLATSSLTSRPPPPTASFRGRGVEAPDPGDEVPVGPKILWNTWHVPAGLWPVQTAKTYPVRQEDREPIIQWPWSGQKEKTRPVRVESEVVKARRRRPRPCCVVCAGRGAVMCERCNGRGRVNRTDLVILPRGTWPKWCWYCRGSGHACCARCMGTGERRGVIGFHVPAGVEAAAGPNGSPGDHQRRADWPSS